MWKDEVEFECLSFGRGACDWLCNLPTVVLDLCNEERFVSSFGRFADVICRENAEFLFAESAPRMFLPDAVLNKPMAPAADPLDSFAAALPSSLRASLSHQNSQARESRARPLKLR
jgi:hypothetical protein